MISWPMTYTGAEYLFLEAYFDDIKSYESQFHENDIISFEMDPCM